MAHRSRKCWPFVLAAASLLVTARVDQAQEKVPPPAVSAPLVEVKKEPEPVKQLSKKEADVLIEKSFGDRSDEIRRPIRLWIPDLGMAVAAKEAIIAKDGLSVRFVSVSLALPAESQTLHGPECTIVINQAIAEIDGLPHRTLSKVELRSQSGGTILITALGSSEGGGNFRTVTKMVPVTRTVTEMQAVTENIPIAVAAVGAPVGAPQDLAIAQPRRPVDVRFNLKLDPKTPIGELLPSPNRKLAKLPAPLNEDLTKVAEIGFGEPVSKEAQKQIAMEATSHAIAKINHLNLKKTDGFLLAMLERRSDLSGMPFLMGEECKTREDQARAFALVAEAVQQSVRAMKNSERRADGSTLPNGMIAFAAGIAKISDEKNGLQDVNQEMLHRALVAALAQIVTPESEILRVAMAKSLATIPHVDATKALARLAIFSPEDDVRAAAIEGLKSRRERDYSDILTRGMRYPLPAVAKRAAEAMVKLERKDMLGDLIDVLESPDPRMPVAENRDGKDVLTVRELVKVNHHRNCLLCHAPGNTENTPEGVLKVMVPLTTEPLPKPTDSGGYQKAPPTSDMIVRIDMTYLRQDFSLMMPVADAHPWPEMQRFDFLVRTRQVTPEDARAYEACREADEPGRLSAYHRAALFALRELSGRDAEPTPQAWRKMLSIAKRS